LFEKQRSGSSSVLDLAGYLLDSLRVNLGRLSGFVVVLCFARVQAKQAMVAGPQGKSHLLRLVCGRWSCADCVHFSDKGDDIGRLDLFLLVYLVRKQNKRNDGPCYFNWQHVWFVACHCVAVNRTCENSAQSMENVRKEKKKRKGVFFFLVQ
jgi:hypothetical protein